MEKLSPSELAAKLRVSTLPTVPCVYLYKNEAGEVIYVGKAKNLRNRVRQYFQEGKPVDAKTMVLRSKIASLEYIVTDTEPEALLLENTLIKEHKPKYNILLKDDKSYPYIRITNEDYPRVFKTRRVVKDGSKYYGPYTDGTFLYYLMKTIRAVFPLRTCELPLTTDNVKTGRFTVCLEYHIKRCDGPCENLISQEEYLAYIHQVEQILTGRSNDLELQMEQHMQQLSDELRFEEARIVLKRLERLREYTAKQKVVSADSADRDVFALARIGNNVCTVIFTVRNGQLTGKRHFFIKQATDTDGDILRSVIEQWYVEQDHVPAEVMLPFAVDDESVIEFLRMKSGKKVEFLVPKIGDKKKLLSLAETNADHLLRELLLQQAQKDQVMPRAVMSLQRDLHLSKLPRRIECFDNSHMQGTDYVSSMVVFVDGKPRSSEFRTFRLRTVEGNNDFDAMKEVITRRYSGSLKDMPLPDLCIIDGGRGQLNAALDALRSVGIAGSFTVIGLAKKLEEVIVPGEQDSVFLPKTSSSLRLLQQARDQAHRVAINYHRKLRSSRTLQSELEQINGVGAKTAARLLIALGSVESIKHASKEQLMEIVSKKVAESIYGYFHS